MTDPFVKPVENLAGEIQIMDISDKIMRGFLRMGFSCHIAVGGDGSLEIAHRFAQKGMPVIGVPKTIDNDLEATDRTFGFDTAVSTATDVIDKLHSTGRSRWCCCSPCPTCPSWWSRPTSSPQT